MRATYRCWRHGALHETHAHRARTLLLDDRSIDTIIIHRHEGEEDDEEVLRCCGRDRTVTLHGTMRTALAQRAHSHDFYDDLCVVNISGAHTFIIIGIIITIT